MSTDDLEFYQLQSIINFCLCAVARVSLKYIWKKKREVQQPYWAYWWSCHIKQENMTFNQVHIHFAFRKIFTMFSNWISPSYPGLAFAEMLCMSSIQSQLLLWNLIKIPSIYVSFVFNSRQIAQRILISRKESYMYKGRTKTTNKMMPVQSDWHHQELGYSRLSL